MSEQVKWADLSTRERDALVAEQVMGWTETRVGIDGSRRFHPPGDSPTGTYPVKCDGLDWSPSTDIAAAWDVVEKMEGSEGNSFWLWRDAFVDGSLVWVATFEDTFDPLDAQSAVGDTAPEAICLAALRAVGVEVEE